MTTQAEFKQRYSHEAIAAAIASHPEPYDDSFTGQPSAKAAIQRFAFAEGFDAGVASVAPRVVSTVAELDALELGSVILDEGGLARQANSSSNGENYWDETGTEDDLSSSDLIAHVIACKVEPKFTVLWVGGTE